MSGNSISGMNPQVSNNYGGERATTKGTRIVKPGTEMDKNAFLKILAAELTNQDPMAAKDSTQYVTQMAQFSSMEQMANLNSTMTTYSANSLVGKNVVTKVKDIYGVAYNGIVRDVTKSGSQIKLGVEVNNNGKREIYEFDFNEVQSVTDLPNYSMDYMSANTALIAAANLIGKKGEFDVKDEAGNSLTGVVKGIVKEADGLKLRVQSDVSGEVVVTTLDKLIRLDMD